MGVRFMKQFKKIFKTLKMLAGALVNLFILVYLGIYLLGVRQINVGGLNLTFKQLTGTSILIVSSAYLARDKVNSFLSVHDAHLAYQERKKRCQSLRIVCWATWFAIYFPIYVYGQTFYQNISQSDMFDLCLVLLYGIVAIRITISMPTAEDEAI